MTPEQVIDLRRRYRAGGVTMTHLAADVGMSPGGMYGLLRGGVISRGVWTARYIDVPEALTAEELAELRRRNRGLWANKANEFQPGAQAWRQRPDRRATTSVLLPRSK